MGEKIISGVIGNINEIEPCINKENLTLAGFARTI
jgi:hypothetical protein